MNQPNPQSPTKQPVQQQAKPKTAISPTRAENYPEWYQQVVRAADLAENSDVRGCMVIKPWGYALWENVQRDLDEKFKATGHQNAYFPLFIPKSFLEKEAKHVEGFAKECAVVTHHRLVDDGKGGLMPDPESKLEEPLIVRPTSETIIGASFARWVESYRDLPILINQWANVVRWEMRTRLFLRTTEFLWQEGHTAHATAKEAQEETAQMHEVYREFAEGTMAMPVIKGEKPAHERFPGAVNTYTIEAMMQDKKALQAGTSHFLGQNFAHAQDIKFLGADGAQHHCWTTSWGVSTRLIGGLIMTHADDDGLVCPPKMAPAHVVILPVTMKAENPQDIIDACENLAKELRKLEFGGRKLVVQVDKRDLKGADKMWQWIKKGAPVRVEIGPRDLAAGTVFAARRDTGEKKGVPQAEFVAGLVDTLQSIQDGLLAKAKAFRAAATKVVKTEAEFMDMFKGTGEDNLAPGFALAHFCGDEAIAKKLQDSLKVTVRCIPCDGELAKLGVEGANEEAGTCIFTGKPSSRMVVWAKSY